MKPYQVLAFFISVVLVLLFLSLVFPDDGIRLSESIKLRFFHVKDLFTEDSVEYADISSIVQIATDERELTIPVLETEELPGDPYILDTLGADPDSLKKIIYPIEFPPGKEKLFSPFFEKAVKLKTRRELIRIMHYGDSQIETDRITGYLRNRMQLLFGGSGCGLIPAVPLYNGKMSIRQDYSSNWKRYTGFAKVDTSLGHRRFGALFSFSSLRKNLGNQAENGWIELSPSPIAYATSRKFDRLALFMGKTNTAPSELVLYVNDSLADRKNIDNSFHYRKFLWNLPENKGRVKLEFGMDSSISIYGVSLDNSWGVAVDNIPLRGSAGLEFSRTDTSLLKKMYRDLNVGMLILQFGGNVVPYIENAGSYENFLKRELSLLKKLLPGIPILIIGPSDMSVKEKNHYVTYPNLEKVRDAMKKAAFESGCAFWDMYEAMGGKNSMPSWVFAEPPLAVDDFVHFNSKGSRIIAEMIYNSIYYEYEIWRSGTGGN